MQGSKKILTIIIITMLTFAIAISVIFVINFRNFAKEKEFEKAKVIASLVKDGLTAHMVNQTMNKRSLFLHNAKDSCDAIKIWIFRTKKVEDLFGKGFPNEKIEDDIDKKAIKTGKPQIVLDEKLVNPRLRITIPYIATIDQEPNCLKCHTNAKEGDVLGGISMIFSADEARMESIKTILKILGIIIIFLFVYLYGFSKLLKPYTDMLTFVRDSLEKANHGDYSSRIDIKKDDKSLEVAKWLNAFLEKLELMIGSIEKNMSLFVADRRKIYNDPLEKSQSVIEDIAMIYRFKRTIEQDESKEIIYDRLIKIFKEHLRISNLTLYEIDMKKNKREMIYSDDTSDDFCLIADKNPIKYCRSYRTKSIVSSDDFDEVCKACKADKPYLCIFYTIDENISLILTIKPQNSDELCKDKKAIGYIKNYLESARPVLQSKILTDILRESSFRDGLTGLYNRKFLDNFLAKEISQQDSYAVAMVDIDYFKKVNDKFGHPVGDEVLVELSKIFKDIFDKDSVVFRFGGEEFLIFIPGTKTYMELLKKLKDRFEKKTFFANNTSFTKTISIGVSLYKEDSEHIWQVVKYADTALYEAKKLGRNKIVLYKDISN